MECLSLKDIVEVLDAFGESGIVEAGRRKMSMKESCCGFRSGRPEAEHSGHRKLELKQSPAMDLRTTYADPFEIERD